MKGYIFITLRSDLCAANGDGFSLSIDTDICADRYGLPFIPSRRLKGCLKKAAEYIGCDHINSIFGISGSASAGSLRISDARLSDYESLKLQAESSECPAEKILTLFTSVKASTAIENDTAKENSLRFTRVINHYSPFDQKEQVFVSEVEYADSDAEHLERICKALRHIGYKRNRGYGSVKCEFRTADKNDSLSVSVPDDERLYELRFTVKLESPAMFAGKSSMETLDYIPGSAVLGAFASKYLSDHKADERFEELFLTGALRFSDLYISDGRTVSEPAPAVLGKQKGRTEIKYVNDKYPDGEMPPKAFKGGYLIGKTEIKPLKETIYHHRNKHGDEEALLYTQECLSEGQLFSGTIIGSGKDLSELVPAIESGGLNLGRSKTAQYSFCRITAAKYVPVSEEKVPSGEVYALLCSDVLLLDDNAAYSTDINVLAKALGTELTSEDRRLSSLKYTTVMGYVSVGRYKRSHIRAFEKGSVLHMHTDKELPRYMTVGERINEGFGVIKLCRKEELMALGRDTAQNSIPADSTEGVLSELLRKNDARENLRTAALDYVDKKYDSVKNTFTLSFVGRLLLMVRQAENKEDLDNRVASIKSDDKRKAAQDFIKEQENIYADEWREFLMTALTVIKYRMKEADVNEQKIL